MFSRTARKAQESLEGLDYTQVLRDPSSFHLGHLADLGLGSELTAFAFDPVQSLLAVGTEQGRLFVFGGPAVQVSWDLGRPIKIKHLAFKAGSGFLCCVDVKDTLAVYDLSRMEKGKPARDSTLSMRSVITCLETSPSHGFLFLGGKDGTVDVYDIDRGCLVPGARVPNLWLAQEELLRRSGVQDAPSRRHIPICTDIKSHPLDISLLLISYEGGVALWNIALRRVERSWEFVIPPGAPGGGNDEESQLFTERRLAVTCLAWRPDGLMFAVGHEDGCFSFAFCSDDLPITIRTLERADVHKTTEEDLFGWSAQGKIGERKPVNREPIFRLAWSGFPEETYLDMAVAGWNAGSTSSPPLSPLPSGSRIPPPPLERTHLGGGTILTILGGLLPSDPTGIHLFEFPPYVPPTTQNAISASGNIPAPLRQALKDSVSPLQHNLYPTSTPPEDFLLLPRSSPHYGMAYDPSSILITTSPDTRLPVLAAPHAARGIEAWSFPPTSSHPARPLRVSSALSWSGGGTATSVEIFSIPTRSYRRLVHQFESSDEGADRLPLAGGQATQKARAREATGRFGGAGEGGPRVLVSTHVDLSVRFWDVSTHVLRGELVREFATELMHLRVEMSEVLRMGSVGEASRIFRERPWEVEIGRVGWSRETLELSVMFTTGDLVVLRFEYGEQGADGQFQQFRGEDDVNSTINNALEDMSISSSAQVPAPTPTTRRKTLTRKGSVATSSQASFASQDTPTDLSSLPNLRPRLDGFRPVAGFALPASSRTCIAVSDIGFFAASSEASLLVVNMRGPEVLLFDSPGRGSSKGKGRSRADPSPITTLTWTISAISEDHDRNPRLIVVQASGFVRVFELSHVAGTWILSDSVVSFSHDTIANSFGSFVLDKYGNEVLASSANLQAALAHQASFSHSDDVKGAFNALWIAVSPVSIAAYYNIDGPRTAVFEDGQAGLEKAMLVMRSGCPVLVVSSRNRSVSTFSLPDLVPITRVSFDAAVHTSAGAISFSCDGDLVQVLDPLNIRLHTLFDIGRPAFPPATELHLPDIPVPPQQTTLLAVKSTMASFFGGSRVYKPSDIEAVLGGPERPPAKNRGPPPTPVPRAPRQPAPRRTEQVQEEVDSTQTILGRTTEALNQRGEHLGYLQEKLGEMANGAAKFAQDAAKTAQREAAKKTIAGGFTSYFK